MSDTLETLQYIGEWVHCSRCGTPQQVTSPGTPGRRGGASLSHGAWFCNDSRECSLRLKRKRRSKV